MGHHAKALGRIDQHDIVGDMRARLGRRGAAYQRSRIDRRGPAGALLHRFRRTAGGAEIAAEILHVPAGPAGLIDDGLGALSPVGEFVGHRTRSRNMLTCDDSTPPSPCSNAIEASRTCRVPARSVICKCVSTRCAIAPPTPQWPYLKSPPWALSGIAPSRPKCPTRTRPAASPRPA